MGGRTEALISQVESLFSGRAKVLVATLTLSAVQLANLNSGIQLLPAPGAGKAYTVHGSFAHQRFGTIAFTAGGTIYLANVAGAGVDLGFWNICPALTVNAASDSYQQSGVPTLLATASNTAGVVNQPLFLNCGKGPFATGDGSLTVTVFYSIVDMTIQ